MPYSKYNVVENRKIGNAPNYLRVTLNILKHFNVKSAMSALSSYPESQNIGLFRSKAICFRDTRFLK